MMMHLPILMIQGARFASSITISTAMTAQSPKTLFPYRAPSFAKYFQNIPKNRLKLANLPTPLQYVPLSNCHSSEDSGSSSSSSSSSSSISDNTSTSVLQPFRDLNAKLWMKRDDMSGGTELGGNKVRKLEFLLADALEGGYDSVITIGGEQSNHCRATVS